MNGSGRPLFGSALVTTPMLMAAWRLIKNVTPAANRLPNGSRARSAM